MLVLADLLTLVPDRLEHRASRVVVFSLLMLMFVFFVGFLREGISAMSANLRRKRYGILLLNVAVFLAAAVGILIGGGHVVAALFR